MKENKKNKKYLEYSLSEIQDVKKKLTYVNLTDETRCLFIGSLELAETWIELALKGKQE